MHMSEQLVFYTNPMSRGQIVRWMLEEVGAPYEQKVLNFGADMQDPGYLKINPMGKVPSVVHGDSVVTEAAAICAYLADAFPDAGLGPKPEERADYYRWLFFAAGPLEQAVTSTHLGWKPEGKQRGMVGFGTFEQTIDALETAVTGREHICGSRFTAADVYVGSSIDWGLAFETIPKRDAFTAYVERLRSREAYKRAKSIDNELMEKMKDAGTA
jgi:glutathione S-transferase